MFRSFHTASRFQLAWCVNLRGRTFNFIGGRNYDFSVMWPTTSSIMNITGTRNSSARLKALMVRSKHSCGEFGHKSDDPSSPQELETFVQYLRAEWPRRYGLASVASRSGDLVIG